MADKPKPTVAQQAIIMAAMAIFALIALVIKTMLELHGVLYSAIFGAIGGAIGGGLGQVLASFAAPNGPRG